MSGDSQSGTESKLRIGACPQCGQSTRLDNSNSWRPFCSERCKLVDLGGWFGERYGVAVNEAEDFDADSSR